MSFLSNVGASLRNRAPVAYTATRNSPFWRSVGSGDRNAQLDSMDATPALFAIVSSLAADVARVDWKLYRKATDNRRVYSYEGVDSRREVVEHLALRVWNKPNPFMTRQEFVESVQMHFELTGEQWWLPSRMDGISFPTELWPVRPDRMDAVPDPVDFLSGYVYTSPDGTKVPLGVEDAIFVRRPHPMDVYRGISPVGAVAFDIDGDRAAAQYNREFFRNNATPGGILMAPQKIQPHDLADLKRQWAEQHRGVHNAHRTAILAGEGFAYHDTNVSQKDMQFAELRGVSNEMIRMAYRFPRPMLGTSEDVNRANAEAAEVVYARWLMVDRLERMRQALNNDFLPLFGSTGEGVEFDYCNPVPDDREADNAELTAKVTAFQTLVNTNKVDPEEALKFLGLPTDMYREPEPAPMGPAGPVVPGAQDPMKEDMDLAARLNGHRRPRLEV